MRRTVTLLSTMALLVGLVALPAAANAKHCPSFNSPNKVEAPGGLLTIVTTATDGVSVTATILVDIDGKDMTISLVDTVPAGYTLTDATWCLKGGTQQPNNSNGLTGSLAQDISYAIVYGITLVPPGQPPQGGPEWCSPGFWRQSHHLDDWPTTALPEDPYSDIPNAPALKSGAPSDPTLWHVLQSPQVYGGAAFNAVGDYLSGLHPDVDFDGSTRVSNCPL